MTVNQICCGNCADRSRQIYNKAVVKSRQNRGKIAAKLGHLRANSRQTRGNWMFKNKRVVISAAIQAEMSADKRAGIFSENQRGNTRDNAGQYE
jgi:hypothetical protein